MKFKIDFTEEQIELLLEALLQYDVWLHRKAETPGLHKIEVEAMRIRTTRLHRMRDNITRGLEP